MSKKLRTKTPKQQENPEVFHYRMLRSSFLFTFIWTISAVSAFIVIWYFDFKLNSEEGLTLIIASFFSLVLAFHSLEQRGSPYVYLYDDRIKIHYSFLRDVTIQYHNLQDIHVVNEELELVLKSGTSIILNLGHLSFQDQSVLLKTLNDKVKNNDFLSNTETTNNQ